MKINNPYAFLSPSQLPSPRVLGVTGGLATGKSFVVQLLKAKGAVTFSADEASRAILIPRGAVLREVATAFGPEAITPEGNLAREWLGKRIFADTQSRKQLERITHPPILRLLHAQIESALYDVSPQKVIVVEIPLLFETNLQDWFELIVVVSASESAQIARLQTRNGLDASEARRRLAAQWPLSTKMACADVVIQNEGSREEVAQTVDTLWNRIHSQQTLLSSRI